MIWLYLSVISIHVVVALSLSLSLYFSISLSTALSTSIYASMNMWLYDFKYESMYVYVLTYIYDARKFQQPSLYFSMRQSKPPTTNFYFLTHSQYFTRRDTSVWSDSRAGLRATLSPSTFDTCSAWSTYMAWVTRSQLLPQGCGTPSSGR